MKAAKRSATSGKKRRWTRQQRMRFKLAIHKRKAAKAEAEGRKLAADGKLATSLTYTPTRLPARFKSQVPHIDAIYNRFKQLGLAGQRFIIAELMRYNASEAAILPLESEVA